MIFRNALRTPDGTIIESTFRHDYVTHKDANGKTYMVDGGTAYLRRSAHGDEKDLSIESSDDHSHNREYFTWGTYGKDGKGPFRRVALKDMSDGHIKAILDTQTQISEETRRLFLSELEYRLVIPHQNGSSRIPCAKSPCKAGCIGIEVTTFGPKKYYLTTGDCRAPSSDSCCLKINRDPRKQGV